MDKSSTRWVLLSIVLLFSLSLIIIQPNAYAEGIDVKSFSLEETTIISVENNSNEEINTIRIWLGSDFNFKSFKTEKSWVGEKTPQGVVIFTSSESIKPGELVKFGVKTDKVSTGINWKALDNKDTQIDLGKVLSKELPGITTVPEDTTVPDNTVEQNSGPSISSDSIFRIVPEKPNVGASIRVTGDKFGGSQELDFYIDTKKIGSFVTDKDGHFMTTMKIPETQNDGRVDFKIKDKEGEEKKVSIRIEKIENRIPDSEIIKLTIQGISNMVHRGDFLEIFGTGDPNSAITSTVTNEEGEIYVTRTAEVDSKGNWKLEEPIIIPLDMPFGKYSATITDGRQNILKQWTVESDKTIIIAPSNLKFDLGELMKFNGTAVPNKPIEVIMEDPFGKEIFSDIIQVDESGFVNFVYQTTQSSIKGTYTIIATQEKDKEFIFTGLGQLPTIPVNLEFDSLHYKAGDIANISLSGKASEVISLLIIDPSDKPKGDSVSITLQPDGRGTHQLDLEGYASGAYTAVISKAGDESKEIFTVGLQTGSGEIDANITKPSYLPGDSILLLGDTGENVLLMISLMDPDGNIIKEKESFSDKNGKITEDSLRIPTDAKHGLWKINVKSGANFDIIEFEVLALLDEGMTVSIEKGGNIPGLGDTIIIKVFGAEQNVEIEITSNDGKVIGNLDGIITSAGIIDQLWAIPKNTAPGTYTVNVVNPTDSAVTTFEIE